MLIPGAREYVKLGLRLQKEMGPLIRGLRPGRGRAYQCGDEVITTVYRPSKRERQKSGSETRLQRPCSFEQLEKARKWILAQHLLKGLALPTPGLSPSG